MTQNINLASLRLAAAKNPYEFIKFSKYFDTYERRSNQGLDVSICTKEAYRHLMRLQETTKEEIFSTTAVSEKDMQDALDSVYVAICRYTEATF